MHRLTARNPFLALLLSCLAGVAAAQPAAAPSRLAQDEGKAVIEQRAESITHEDAGSRIDELRVGGQTQSIEVQPKNGAPAYQIQPDNGNGAGGESGGKRTGNAGRSSWRILNF